MTDRLSDADAPRRPRPLRWRRSDAAVLPLLLVLGALLGAWSSLLLPAGPRAGGHLLSAGVLLAVAGNLLFGRVAQRAGGPLGGVALLAGWLAVVFVLAGRRANGSVVLPGSGDLAVPALEVIYGGLVAGVLALVVRPAR